MADRTGGDPLERLGDARRLPEEMTRTFEGDELESLFADMLPGNFQGGRAADLAGAVQPGPVLGQSRQDEGLVSPESNWEEQLRVRLLAGGMNEPRLLASSSLRSRIYLSRHVDLDMNVVVKVFLPGLKPGPGWRSKFLREGRATGKINHPHVLRLLGGGQLADASYLVYEHCSEGSLAERLLLAPPTLRYAGRLFAQMIQGVQAIHNAGFLHLDIKPSNILLAEGGVPKLADLGLARLLDARGLVHVDQVAGTPGYMAPEQTYSGADLSCAADIFSLGSVFYQMITGRFPFQGYAGESIGRMIQRLRRDQVEPPSHIRPEVPEAVDRLVARCLERDPRNRFSMAEELLGGVMAWLGETDPAKEGTALAPSRRDRPDQDLADSLRFAVFRKNLQGRYLFANDAFCLAMGRERSAILGASNEEILAPEMAGRLRMHEVQVLRTGQIHEDVEEHLSRACLVRCRCRLPALGSVENSDRQYIQSFLAPLRDQEGQVMGVQGLFYNITPLKQAERRAREALEKLEKANTELRRSNQDLAQFASVVSHDLQSPLGTVQELLRRLGERYAAGLGDQGKAILDLAQQSVVRMRVMVTDFLAYARAGQGQREPVEVDCQAACAQALANLRSEVVTSGATVMVSTLPRVQGWFTQVQQLFQNLIQNAIKFRGDQPVVVRIGWRSVANRWAHIWVKDNGPGIGEEWRESIFRIFERGPGGASRSGTGLGLALGRRIVEQGGGRIWVESEPGAGAAFHFTLRLVPMDPGKAVRAKDELPDLATSKISLAKPQDLNEAKS